MIKATVLKDGRQLMVIGPMTKLEEAMLGVGGALDKLPAESVRDFKESLTIAFEHVKE